MTIQEAIDNRKSIRPGQFTGALIDRTVIEQLLKSANKAPTHAKTEPWRFYVVAGEQKDAFGDFLQKVYKEKTPEEKYNPVRYKKLKANADASSHILIIAMKRDENERIPEWEEVAATSCAVQNIYLQAASLGVGGFWSSPGLWIRNIDQFLELGERERCLGFFYLGVPNEWEEPTEKGPWEDKVTWL